MLTSTTIRNFVSVDSKERAAATIFSKPETLVGDGAPEDSFVEKMTLPGKNLDLKAAARLVKSESVQKAVQELTADSENLESPERAQIETDTGTWTARRQDADTFFLSQSRRDGILDESIEVRAWNFAGRSRVKKAGPGDPLIFELRRLSPGRTRTCPSRGSRSDSKPSAWRSAFSAHLSTSPSIALYCG